MSTVEAIRRYEESRLGRAQFYLKSTQSKSSATDYTDKEAELKKKKISDDEKERDALSLTRYIVEDVLGWTPEEAMAHITTDIGRRLGMDSLLKYVDSPMEVKLSEDYRWLIHQAYPSQTRYDTQEPLFNLYHKIMAGEIKRFPRNFFMGKDGRKKASALFRDYISRNIPAGSISELYRIFSNSADGWNILRNAHLYHETAPYYSSPLEFLHDALGQEADRFLFSYHQYLSAVTEVEKTERGRKGGKGAEAKSMTYD